LSRKVTQIAFPDGRVQTFSYNASGYLKLVEDTAGYAMVFDYDASGDITAACAFVRALTYVSAASTCTGAAMKTTYTYGTGTMSATDVLGQTTTYTFNTFGLTCIKPPPGTTCSMTLNIQPNEGATTIFGGTQTLADGSVWTIDGTNNSAKPPNVDDTPGAYDGDNEVTVTDPAGKVTGVVFTKSSLYDLTDANGNSSSYRFFGGQISPLDAVTNGTYLTSATYPEGDQYLAYYNGPFGSVTEEDRVPKPGSGLANLVKLYGYQSCTVSPGTYQNCAKPIWIKDPKNNQTDFSYASHGGILYEMDPAPTAGAARPLKLTTWSQRYAWIKNSGGTLVQAATPVWVKATETLCQTVAGSSSPVCDGAAIQTTTTYEYGASGTGESLLVKGVAVASGGTTLRTCSGYDVWHRKISETKPNANLSVCP
jgi:YD repeat-containing protein